jgi:tRNA(Ile)-lysidine synthase TilS/MesJ
MINEAKIATFNPVSYLDRNDLYLIRPFILAYENDTKALVKKLNIPVIVGACPNEFTTQRAKIKALLQKSFYQSNDFKASLLNFRNMLLNGKGCNL